MEEKWVAINGYDGLYEVSSCGRVRSVDRVLSFELNGVTRYRHHKGSIIAQNNNGNGYFSVMLGREKRIYVHRLVCAAFNGTADEKMSVNHIDGNRSNNVPSNLEWCSMKANNAHKAVLGTLIKGAKSHRSKITENDVAYIKAAIANGVARQCDLAEMFGLSRTTICDIINGRSWNHVA